MASLTPKEYVNLYIRYGSVSAVARVLNRNERSFRRWIKNHQDEIDEIMGDIPPKQHKKKEKPDAPLPKQESIYSMLLAKMSKKPLNVKEFAQKQDVSSRIVNAAIEDLRDKGYAIEEHGGLFNLRKEIIPEENCYANDWEGEKVIRLALCGDNQSGSKFTQWTHLHNFYDICKKENIPTVYHTGDITEGEDMRQGHKYECYVQGADEHVAEIIKNYPKRKGIETQFVTGNHDHSLLKKVGYDIGRAIGFRRPDMKYLGQSNAIVNLTPNCTLELRHPIDGSAYSISYKTQKMIEAMQSDTKPNILAIGHYHKAEYLFYRNIHTFQTGCFQAQTSWMKGKQISAHVGGWLVKIHVDKEGTITRCKGEFIPYYRMIKDDWKNWR